MLVECKCVVSYTLEAVTNGQPEPVQYRVIKYRYHPEKNNNHISDESDQYLKILDITRNTHNHTVSCHKSIRKRATLEIIEEYVRRQRRQPVVSSRFAKAISIAGRNLGLSEAGEAVFDSVATTIECAGEFGALVLSQKIKSEDSDTRSISQGSLTLTLRS